MIIYNYCHSVLIVNRSHYQGKICLDLRVHFEDSVYVSEYLNNLQKTHIPFCVCSNILNSFSFLVETEESRQTGPSPWAAWRSTGTARPRVSVEVTKAAFPRDMTPRGTLASWKRNSPSAVRLHSRWLCLWAGMELGMLPNPLRLFPPRW